MKWIKKLFEPKEDTPKLYWLDSNTHFTSEKFTDREQTIIKNTILHPKYKLSIFEDKTININACFIYGKMYVTRIVLLKGGDYYYYAHFNLKNYKIDSFEGVKQFLNDKLK